MFQILDYIILLGMLLISMGIGLFYAFKDRKQTSSKEYFTAGGSMGVLPTTFSLLASILCSVWYIGFPAEVYEFGIHFAWDLPLIPLALILVTYGFLPVFYDLQVTSVNEYLEKRFHRMFRLAGSFMYIVNSALYVAMVIYIPALSVNQVTGLHLWTSIALMGLVGTTYTAIGGMRAIMWTDVFQMIIIYLSMIAIAIKGTVDVGGVTVIFERAIEGNRIAWPPMTVDPRYRYNMMSVLLMCSICWLGVYGISQTQVQRYMSCPTKEKAQRTVWMNMFAIWTVEIILIYISCMLYAHFDGCDPKLNNQIESYDKLLTFFVMKSFHDLPGLPGLFVAGIFSGALSTISSCLNSMAAVTMEDFITIIPKFTLMKDENKTKISKLVAFLYGLLTITLIAFVDKVHSVATFWGYNNGLLLGSLTGLFMLGLFIPWANSSGALISFAFTVSFGTMIAVGAQILKVEFYPEPLSNASCPISSTNFSDTVNVTFHTANQLSPEEYSSLRLYSILSDRGGFKEIFTVSPYIMHPYSCLIVLVLGAVASLFFDSKQETELKLLSPLIRPLVKRKWKKMAQKTASFSHELNHSDSAAVHNEELQIFYEKNQQIIQRNGFTSSEATEV